MFVLKISMMSFSLIILKTIQFTNNWFQNIVSIQIQKLKIFNKLIQTQIQLSNLMFIQFYIFNIGKVYSL
ncbi:hypothetical protein TTHERM_000085669 (macronuclear) [Tetrahymena thermophila SB210]|uniref:Uncharacterized protein n=1 Tax=Tetrahymena thermophila (strain SB210) TaxID=312017 RepID=W7X762_TETTS|nr:hypothetical protein TTHERM_000085669 [Tetrahymena thermophila SB210]EWS75230.1 hypothetical protein TTHERM_000085669 [Tetrahymena thermophila SB210]|eukprot:XP_012652221.1 hypothetical protein TTHERM_000085669 [Tetrahymena thermophila SB210]